MIIKSIKIKGFKGFKDEYFLELDEEDDEEELHLYQKRIEALELPQEIHDKLMKELHI